MSLASLLATVRNASMRSIVATVFALLILRLLLRALYRITLHPLSRFPGPKLSGATRLPYLFHLWRGTVVDHLCTLHAQYGPIVRTSPEDLSIIDPQAWKDVHGYPKQSPHPIPVKHPGRYTKSPNGASTLLIASDEDHPRLRRTFSPAFSDRALKAQEPLFRKYVDLLIAKLEDAVRGEQKGKVDLVRAYNFTTFDVMADLTFGESLHMLENATYDPWVRVIFASIKISTRFRLVKFYPLLDWAFSKVMGGKMEEKRDEHFEYSVERVSKRLKKEREGQHDIWSLVLERELSREEMDAHASLFMVAGTETTATLLSGLTYLLLANPEKMEKLVREIRGEFKSRGDITMEKLANLPYLKACTEEGLRLYPPVPTGLPRWTGKEGTVVCGRRIPPNATISIPHYPMYTSPLNFSQPLSFIPERWLDKDSSDHKDTLQPFSYGPRNCVGKNMAYHEMRLILAHVLWNFDLELCEESQMWKERQKVWSLWEKLPLWVRLSVRE